MSTLELQICWSLSNIIHLWLLLDNKKVLKYALKETINLI